MDLFIVLLILHVLLMLNWSICLPQQPHLSLKPQDLIHHPYHRQQEDYQLQNTRSLHPLTNNIEKQSSPPEIKRRHKMISSNNNSTPGKLEETKMLNERSEKHRFVIGLEKLVKLIRFITPTRCRQWRKIVIKLDSLPYKLLQCIKSVTNVPKHLILKKSVVEQEVGITVPIQTHRNNRNKHSL